MFELPSHVYVVYVHDCAVPRPASYTAEDALGNTAQFGNMQR